eukprot:5281080-Alexandrium_andersonii.AAC.1
MPANNAPWRTGAYWRSSQPSAWSQRAEQRAPAQPANGWRSHRQERQYEVDRHYQQLEREVGTASPTPGSSGAAPAGWAHGEQAWQRTKDKKEIAVMLGLYGKLAEIDKESDAFVQRRLAHLRARARGTEPPESRRPAALREVAEARARCERAQKHKEEADRLLKQAEDRLTEAEENLQAIIEQDDPDLSGSCSPQS